MVDKQEIWLINKKKVDKQNVVDKQDKWLINNTYG